MADVPVEVLQVSLVYQQQLMVLVTDLSMACTVSKWSTSRVGVCYRG